MSDLPDPGTPLTLADGTQINPSNGAVIRPNRPTPELVSVPTIRETRDKIVETRRRLIDMPEAPEKMNVISVVVAYQLSGFSNNDIALALNVPVDQINRILALEAVQQLREWIIEGIKAQDSESTRRIISDASTRAARRVAGLVDSEDDQIALAASKDLLDRDGHRPADIVEHRHTVEGGLAIRYIDDSAEDATRGVTIDAINE